MDRTYWEKKKADIQSLKPSAPSAVAPPQTNGLKIPREHTDNTRVVLRLCFVTFLFLSNLFTVNIYQTTFQ